MLITLTHILPTASGGSTAGEEDGCTMLGAALSFEGHKKNRLPLPILIVDEDSPTLHHALKNDFPELTFDLCPSLVEAERHLLIKPYQALVTNVRFAEMGHFSLLKWNQDKHPPTPFLITVEVHHKKLAYKALEQGALDCILKPVNTAQAVPAMREALWLYRFRVTIAQRKDTLDALKTQHAALVLNMQDKPEQADLIERGIKQVEKTINSCERTIAAIETSLQCLNRCANAVEHRARQRALARLDAMSD